MKIAVLLTCHNRKEKTLKCLFSLFTILLDCDVFLVDDASSDGTSAAIKENFPRVNIMKGGGDLFWSRGMHLVWSEAIKKEYDYYLWLNDDTELYPFFFEELIKCSELGNKHCIVSGLVEDADENIIYGGTDENRRKLQISGTIQKITNMNGNIVLIPKSVVDEIGILDPVYHHDLGDVDYGLRAIKAGIDVYSTRKAIGLGVSNNFCRVRKWDTTLEQRFKKLYSPLGSHPRINFYFRKKHFGIINAVVYWLYLHMINILPDKIVTVLWGDLYHDK